MKNWFAKNFLGKARSGFGHGRKLVWLLASGLWAAHALAANSMGAMPPPGPKPQVGKRIIFVAADFKNAGVIGVYRGLEAAARTLAWKVDVVDGQGKPDVLARLMDSAVADGYDGIVLGGFDASKFGAQVALAKKAGRSLVGWHSVKEPGPTRDLFTNVATDTNEVARMAADFVIQDARAAKKELGVVIFNDSEFAVANAKTEVMTKTLEACAGYQRCKLLAVQNVAIAKANTVMGEVVAKLAADHGTAWTYSLAINDIYFDHLGTALATARRTDVQNVSAGDGSNKAFARIELGSGQQIASVAEPLKMQGYQLADELNRAFARAPHSGVVSKPILVTQALLKTTGKRGIESMLGFEAAYEAVWKKGR
ncbi:MAG: hypothetical protein CFE43_06270 [Burkholderiales bacterium PBB3]|nr:MAG: hypothetical protein CFE43_06270 [Burkholderiales bacterium PBB3]